MLPKKTEIWLSVEDAGKRLGLKPRRMLDYKDKIRSRYVPNPKSGKDVLTFDAADVERFREAREKAAETGLTRASRNDAAIPQETAALTSGSDPLGFFGALIDRAIAARATVITAGAKPPMNACLTLEEASTYRGLSTRLLRHLVRTGELKALHEIPPKRKKDEPKLPRAAPGFTLRFCREDLDALRGRREVEHQDQARAVAISSER
jgi:hypothetical protein